MAISRESNVVYISFLDGTEEEREERLRQYFTGEIATWADYRIKNFGEVIVPKHVAIKVPTYRSQRAHATFFVEHAGTLISDHDMRDYHCHHMVCSCVLDRNLNDRDGGINLDSCPEMHVTANLRARRFGKEIRAGLAEPDNPISVLDNKVAIAAIETILVMDSTSPEIWPGTVLSGRLGLEQAGELTGQPPENIALYIDMRGDETRLVVDSGSIRLAA